MENGWRMDGEWMENAWKMDGERIDICTQETLHASIVFVS